MNKDTVNALDVIFDVAVETSNSATDIAVITPTELVRQEPEAPRELTIEEREAKDDYNLSRTALTVIALDAQTTLHRAVEAANQTDTPRAFEAVADMVRANIELHREIQQLHKTSAEIRLANKAAGQSTTQVNVAKGVIFSGSSEELLRMISKDRN